MMPAQQIYQATGVEFWGHRVSRTNRHNYKWYGFSPNLRYLSRSFMSESFPKSDILFLNLRQEPRAGCFPGPVGHFSRCCGLAEEGFDLANGFRVE